jgi:hypothetical protein
MYGVCVNFFVDSGICRMYHGGTSLTGVWAPLGALHTAAVPPVLLALLLP